MPAVLPPSDVVPPEAGPEPDVGSVFACAVVAMAATRAVAATAAAARVAADSPRRVGDLMDLDNPSEGRHVTRGASWRLYGMS
ncbi:hypothetical protein GCM10010413_08880 [Promicromonospora sukumoe]